jgi:hypothetical protein
LNFRHPEAVGERGVQVARLLRDALTLLRREPVERPHVVQAVGELDENDPCVLRDRQQELAVVLDLPLLRGVEREVADLRQPVDDLGDLAPELALDVLDRDGRVLDDVVDQSARDRHGVELKVGEDLRDFNAV